MNGDVGKLIVALALVAASVWLVVSSASPPRKRRAKRGATTRARLAPPELSGAAPPADAGAIALPVTPASTRPRIFTGEPTPAELGRPATRKALKLAAGITILAAVGAIALLALVSAMVEAFQRIGG